MSETFNNNDESDILEEDKKNSSDDNPLSHDIIIEVRDAIRDDDLRKVQAIVNDLHPADAADLIELLTRDEREHFIHALGSTLDSDILVELDDSVKNEVLKLLSPEDLAKAITDIDSSDAVYILEDLPPSKIQAVLSRVNTLNRIAVEQAFSYPEYSAARIMRREFLTIPSFWSVGQTVDFFMDSEDLPEKFYEIYVVDPSYKPVGSILLADLFRHKRTTKLADIADTDFISTAPEIDQSEIAYKFEHYRLSSVPVIGPTGRIVGVILVDDIVDIIVEEADDDIKQLAGVGGEELNDPILRVVKNRGWWLFINLWTAILAAIVISYFASTIEQFVILAAMGPLVASMGGNAASQSLTVSIRALAMRTLTVSNASRIIRKELIVGLVNGAIFAIIIALMIVGGALLKLWDFDIKLLGIMGAAMLIELVAAALSGILIPLAMQKLKIDPAVSAVVLVTTVTDVVGFFSVLGLAATFLG